MIDPVLEELAARLDELGVRGKWRRRVLAEARDHLEELDAEDEADAAGRFGDVGEVARLVAAGLATSRTRSAAFFVFGALALTGLVYTASLALVGPAGGWTDVTSGHAGAFGPLLAIALVVLPQVAFVSGCLALLRSVRIRRMPVAEAELSLVRRRCTVALASGAATLLALGLMAANEAGALAAWWVVGTIAACVLLVIPLAFASVGVVRAGAPAALPGGGEGDVFDDLAPVFSNATVRRLDLPAHPWRFAALTAASVGLAGCAAGWYAEGDPGSGLVRGGFEAIALLACFALLGRVLGLRRSE